MATVAPTGLGPKRKLSFVWNYFDMKSENEVRCKKCGKVLFKTSTGSLVKHLKGVHNIVPPEVEEDDPDDPQPSGSKKTQKTLDCFGITSGRPCNSSRQLEVTKSVASMIAQHNLPLHFVEYEGFRKLLAFSEPNWKPVSYETIKKMIDAQKTEIKNTLMALLKENLFTSLTTDGWTSIANEAFLVITGTTITEDFILKTMVLDTLLLTERHTAVYLEGNIKSVIDEWGIGGKIPAVVHDNAANINKTAEHINEGVDIGCSAHSLQLCITDAMGMKASTLNHVIGRTINAASHLVGHFNHSPMATNELKRQQRVSEPNEEPLKPIQYCCTRWNSVCDMFERLIKLRVPIFAVLNNPTVTKPADAKQLDLSTNQWELISDLLPLLLKLKTANTLLCGEDYVSISMLYPVIHRVKTFLVRDESDSAIITAFKQDMRSAIEKRFISNFVQFVGIASYLDPRFKLLQFLPEGRRNEVLDCVSDVCDSVILPDTEEGEVTHQAEDDFFGEVENVPTDVTTASVEYEMYKQAIPIARSKDPLIWWQNNKTTYPRLAILARKYLCVPATSVASERFFSAAGLVIRKQRTRLLPETSSALLFVNQNISYGNK